ncbi:MAG: DNAase, partial [Burkholderia sp.]|nr:DNAase [Burkholderia sp.]
VGRFIASERGIAVEALADATTQNFFRLFKIAR